MKNVTILLFAKLFFTFVSHTNPTSIDEYYRLAYTLKEAHRMHEAIPLYQQIIKAQPGHSCAHIGLAQAYLATGNLVDGFQELEWHLGNPQTDTQRLKEFLQQYDRLDGLRILIRTEWGLGDTLQFMRYAKLLHDRGAIIIIELQKPLGTLFKLIPYVDYVILPGDQLVPFHLQITTLSLPAAFETSLETVPAEIPYIFADPELEKKWYDYFALDAHFKVGICWRGNYIHGIEKFMPLEKMAQISLVPNVSIYSLQMHHGLEELPEACANYPLKLLPLDIDTISGAFMDTAAIMMNLDLVITVDTSLAHLAGGLGRPVWLVVPWNCDWRWMQDRDDSPWYPTMKIFRQQEPGNWDNVIHDMTQKLLQFLSNH